MNCGQINPSPDKDVQDRMKLLPYSLQYSRSEQQDEYVLKNRQDELRTSLFFWITNFCFYLTVSLDMFEIQDFAN